MRMYCLRWWKRRARNFRLLRRLTLLLVLLFPFSGLAQGIATNVALIPVGLAQHVASEHVHANNQPFLWQSLDSMILYDIDGNPNGYAFIFAKAQSRFNGPVALRQHVTDHAAATANQEPNGQSPSDNDLFAFDELATVITGATSESPLILRHFRGTPEFWIEAVKLDASRRVGAKESTRAVMVTPMDFRFVSMEGKAATETVGASEQVAAISLAASAETIAVHSRKVERISALRQRAQDREIRARKRIESMTPEQRQRHEAAQQERKDFLRSQWDSKRKEWENARRLAEGQR